MLTIECRDVGRLLLEQLTFPPLVPSPLYPLEYVPAGKSKFDSTFSPNPNTGTSPASFSEVRCLYYNSATDVLAGSPANGPGSNVGIFGNKGSYASDGNLKTYALSPAVDSPMNTNGYFWWEFALEKTGGSGRRIQGVTFTPWAGGYTAYISIKRNGVWLGSETVPGGNNPKTFIKKVNVPLKPPDGNEKSIAVDFGQPIEADYIRITLGSPMYYSGQADGSGNTYRCGLRNLYARAIGDKSGEWSAPGGNLPWTFGMDAHPVRGYWVAESNGYVHGFGDAADYDSSSFGYVLESPPLNPVNVPVLNPINNSFAGYESRYLYKIDEPGRGTYQKPTIVDLAAHPSGEGYWVLDNTGRVYNYGAAELHYGYHPGFRSIYPPYNALPANLYYVTVPWTGMLFGGLSVTAMSIAATYTGEGYWVLYSDGSIRGFGDAVINGKSFWQTPLTNTSINMINNSSTFIFYYVSFGENPYGFRKSANFSNYEKSLRGTSITSHPNKIGFWVADGSGQVFSFGDAQNYGGLVNRVYNGSASRSTGSGNSFRLRESDWPHGLTATKSGNGYWIAFASGKIASFGDAVAQGDGDIYEGSSRIDLAEQTDDWSFFRYLVWDVVRDPDGEGFWTLLSNGDVKAYKADFWGNPGWWGQDGVRWTLGNYQEYTDIVKDLLAWSGFTAYDGEADETIKKWSGTGTFAVPTLTSGASYTVGDYMLRMESSGDLILRENSTIVWRSNTSTVGVYKETVAGSVLLMQPDGNLVIYKGNRQPVWYSRTDKKPGAYLILRDDGHLSVVSPNGADLLVLHQGSPNAYDRPEIYGNIESTGIVPDKSIPGDKFDKRTVLDCINEIKQVVGYNVYVDQDGRVHFESPNWWSAGNFDDDGIKIYVTYDEEGNFTRVNEEDLGAELFIPEIDEAVSLTNYSATLDGDSLRSEIVIGSDYPDPNNPSATSYVRFSPPSATDEIRSGVPALRNIVRPAVWIDNTFTDKEEQKLMAELINLQVWFSQRTGSVTCIANPNISINDQIKIVERNTSETYVHYVRAVSSSMDLDTGQYVMNLTTNWLGNQDDWVITSDNVYNPIKNISVSESVDRWQQVTGRNLQFSGLGKKPVVFTGEFVEVV
jgi:hypothetical protein